MRRGFLNSAPKAAKPAPRATVGGAAKEPPVSFITSQGDIISRPDAVPTKEEYRDWCKRRGHDPIIMEDFLKYNQGENDPFVYREIAFDVIQGSAAFKG